MMHVCIHNSCVYMCVYMHVCMVVYSCMCVYICVCVRVYIHVYESIHVCVCMSVVCIGHKQPQELAVFSAGKTPSIT